MFANPTFCTNNKFYSLNIDPLTANISGEFTISSGHSILNTNPDQIYTFTTEAVSGNLSITGQAVGPSPLVEVMTVQNNGDIDFHGNKLRNVANPTRPFDVATKYYVDAGGGGGGNGSPTLWSQFPALYSVDMGNNAINFNSTINDTFPLINQNVDITGLIDPWCGLRLNSVKEGSQNKSLQILVGDGYANIVSSWEGYIPTALQLSGEPIILDCPTTQLNGDLYFTDSIGGLIDACREVKAKIGGDLNLNCDGGGSIKFTLNSYVRASINQGGILTTDALPRCSQVPGLNNELVNKLYVDGTLANAIANVSPNIWSQFPASNSITSVTNQNLNLNVLGSGGNLNFQVNGNTKINMVADGTMYFNTFPVCGNIPISGSELVNKSYVDNNFTSWAGYFFDTTSQTNLQPINTFTYNTTVINNGINALPDGNIIISNPGTYNIQFSAQVIKNDAGTDWIDIWLNKNGNAVPNTNTRVTLTNNGIASAEVAAWNFFEQFNANDTFSLQWYSADAGMSIEYLTITGGPQRPNIPSIILSVNKIY